MGMSRQRHTTQKRKRRRGGGGEDDDNKTRGQILFEFFTYPIRYMMARTRKSKATRDRVHGSVPSETNENNRQLKEKNKKLQAKLDKLTEELETSNLWCKWLNEMVDVYAADDEKLEEKVRELEKQIKHLGYNGRNLEETLKKIKDKSERIRHRNNKIAQLIPEIKEQKVQNENLKKELNQCNEIQKKLIEYYNETIPTELNKLKRSSTGVDFSKNKAIEAKHKKALSDIINSNQPNGKLGVVEDDVSSGSDSL